MKVLAINGSPKKDGNTSFALRVVASELEAAGIETETIHVGGKALRGCVACGRCAETMDGNCVIDDGANEWIAKMIEADGLLLGSPVYYAGVNGTMKSFLDRAFFAASSRCRRMRLKVGASVVAVRRAGASATLDQLNKYLTISEMIVPSSNYWNVIHGMAPTESADDDEGVQTMRVLGRNMAWLMKVIEAGKAHVEPPPLEEKVFTNFIR